MVSDGSLHYDHDKDGTHTQLGGEHTGEEILHKCFEFFLLINIGFYVPLSLLGCEAKFRNKDHETQVLIRYVGDTISVSSFF